MSLPLPAEEDIIGPFAAMSGLGIGDAKDFGSTGRIG
jgi:hypothetical protein